MAIELRNPLTITEETKIYGHNTVDIDGVPTDAGNGNVGQIVDIVDTKYIQGIKTDIDNIKAKINGEIYRTQLVDANAYQIDVPSPVFPYAEVQKIKGKSVVWNQLIKIKDSSFSYKGITFTKQEDGTFLANGTSTANDGDYINKGDSSGFKIIANHNYYIWGSDYGDTTTNCMIFQIKRTNGTYYTLKQTSNLGIIYTSEDLDADGYGSVFYFVSNGTTLTNVKVSVNIADLTLMFGAGNEPTLEECQKIFTADYYPYDEGTLKSFPVQRVKSVGKNLAKNIAQSKRVNGVTFTVNDDKSITVVGTANNSIEFALNDWTNNKKNELDNGTYYISDGGINAILILNKIVDGKYNGGIMRTSFTLTDSIKGGSLYIYIDKGKTVNETLYPQIEAGSVATNYSPYRESTIDLSSATADMKSAGSVADEWQNGKVVHKVGSRAYTSGDESDSSLITDRTTTYYPLTTLTEETVPLTEQFIDVESKGTLTFISDESVQMPIESTTKFVVNLEEV